MWTRRAFLRTGGIGAAAFAAFTNESLARVTAAASRAAGRDVSDLARDENYWREIQQAFTLDRTVINLNNGGCCPSPRVVHEAFKRYLDATSLHQRITGVDVESAYVLKGVSTRSLARQLHLVERPNPIRRIQRKRRHSAKSTSTPRQRKN